MDQMAASHKEELAAAQQVTSPTRHGRPRDAPHSHPTGRGAQPGRGGRGGHSGVRRRLEQEFRSRGLPAGKSEDDRSRSPAGKRSRTGATSFEVVLPRDTSSDSRLIGSRSDNGPQSDSQGAGNEPLSIEGRVVRVEHRPVEYGPSPSLGAHMPAQLGYSPYATAPYHAAAAAPVHLMPPPVVYSAPPVHYGHYGPPPPPQAAAYYPPAMYPPPQPRY